jgi:DNA helicase-2/ATP-dependent DNA helicase PcrA
VLTYKIAYLIENGFPAASILALTFTNKAANEMKGRITQIIGNKLASYLWAGTFHGIFLKILQREASVIGFQPNFTIYDTSDAKSLVKSIIKEMKLDEKIYTPQGVYFRISKMKNQLILSSEYRSNQQCTDDDFHTNRRFFADIYQTYSERCKAHNAMDFDDILCYSYLLFKNNPKTLEHYQNRFSYILVDEYQDTNVLQHKIISLLAENHKRVCVVGDDAQSIYSFRGANLDNILTFQQIYQECKLFKLEENYRSTQNIVNLANSLIAKNRFQIPKNVYSNLQKGEKIKIFSCFSDRNEAEVVVDELEKAVAKGVSYSEITILYRTNAQSRVFEDALRNKRIPYKIFAGNSFYSRKEIKDILAYMRLVINHSDEESLRRVINYPARGIGEVSQNKIFTFAHQTHKNSLDLIFDIHNTNIDLNSGTRNKVQKFADIIYSLSEFYQNNDAYLTAEKVIVDSGIMKDLSSNDDPENISRKENVQELLSAIHDYCEQKKQAGVEKPSLAEFLAEVSLLTDQDADTEENQEKITLMTIHSAKGLEFKYVFVVGLEEELFPSAMCESERELEEERRLLYVAITRAKERCFLSYAKTRFRHGQVLYCMPSRFLDDLDEEYLDFPSVFAQESTTNFFSEYKKPNFPTFRNDKIYTAKPQQEMPVLTKSNDGLSNNFKPLKSISGGDGKFVCNNSAGERVKHGIFGIGTILEINGEGDNAKAKIDFDNLGIKQLLLKYSKLEKV